MSKKKKKKQIIESCIFYLQLTLFYILHDSLDPIRVDTIPNAILEIVLNISTTVTQQPTTTTPSQLTQEDLATRRNPVYEEVEAALQNYTHIDRPPSCAPGDRDHRKEPSLRRRIGGSRKLFVYQST